MFYITARNLINKTNTAVNMLKEDCLIVVD